MKPRWSLEHRQTSMQVLDRRGAVTHAGNEASREKQTVALNNEVVFKQERIECVVQCPEEAVWEIKVNETTCGGVKHIRSGNVLEIHVTLQLHAQQKHGQNNN